MAMHTHCLRPLQSQDWVSGRNATNSWAAGPAWLCTQMGPGSVPAPASRTEAALGTGLAETTFHCVPGGEGGAGRASHTKRASPEPVGHRGSLASVWERKTQGTKRRWEFSSWLESSKAPGAQMMPTFNSKPSPVPTRDAHLA